MAEQKFTIVSDGSCDLPESIIREQDIGVVHFYVTFDQKEYRREGVEINLDTFYQRMIDEPKVYPGTAAPSPEDFHQVFSAQAKRGMDIVCVCISSKLSSSLQSAHIARDMLAEEFPDIRVIILDSLACTLMQGAYVLELCRLRDMGVSASQAASDMEQLQKTGRILFTVGSLDHLQHGGRIGKVTSIAGTLLDVKPLITLEEGEIHSSGIRRGRRRSLDGTVDLLVSYLQDAGCGPDDCSILIGYGYDGSEAERFRRQTQEKLQSVFGTSPDIPVCRIGATVGVHAGPYSIGYGVIRRADRFPALNHAEEG